MRLFYLLILLMAVGLTGCRSGDNLPDPSSKEYREALSAFYIGLGALQATDDNRAKQKLRQFTQLAPGEPAGWVNLGVLALRQQEFDAAFENLEKGRVLAPDESRIEGMLGLVESKRGKFAEAIEHLRKAVALNPENLKAGYALALEIERQSGEGSESEVQKLIEKILASQPNNLAAQLELIRIAAKRGDAETVKQTVAKIGERAGNWPPEIAQQFAALQSTANGPTVRAAASQVAFLRNVLVRTPEYRQSLAAIKNPTEETGEPFEKFVKLPAPKFTPAEPDSTVAFNPEPVNYIQGKQQWVDAIYLDGDVAPVVVAVNPREARIGALTLPFPGGQGESAGFGHAVIGVDYDYDFKVDLVFAGRGGVKLYRQESREKFVDVTERMKLSPATAKGAYDGAWAADIELDGDLDIVLGPVDGAPLVLRNNGDGTFKELRPFAGAEKLRDFVYADFDGDGDPDATLLDHNLRLKVFNNERLGNFRERTLPGGIESIFAISGADIDSDGRLDLLLLDYNFGLKRLSDKGDGELWEMAEVFPRQVQANVAPPPAGSGRILTGDFDNNGALDVVAGNYLWLNGLGGQNPRQLDPPGLLVNVAVDLNGDGRLDLLGLGSEQQTTSLTNRGAKSYHWQSLRPRGAQAKGDQRINSFGIGGEIEIRSGLLFQKQVINSPVVHFGLGEQSQTDVARIIWPNGSVQGEFELKADQVVLAEQRLKGSCPSLFAWNGKSMEFVKDCAPWSPALGLHINAQTTAGVGQTEEWMKIRGDQLAPRDGFYDLRITAELWETFYIDHYSLVVVDHPANIEVFTDERFSIPPPELKIYVTSQTKSFARAIDDQGRDVSPVVRELDAKYLDHFGRGRYQGVTRDHYVELELPEEAPRQGPLWLIAHGFVHPTDGTVNIAMSQPDSFTPPSSLSLEVPDGKGDWKPARRALGFPAGKKKTILINLANVFVSGAPRRARLRTNLELYWDKLEWAPGVNDNLIRTDRLNPESAELRYRGFSAMKRADESSPELPDYNQLEFTGQKWRDLIGYYTRFGDIRELLAKVDERIVIVNAGDEMRFRFKAPPDPPAGWTRDYVLIGNGWIKDGDYNSTFSKTVLPLPDAAMREYTKPPKRLEDDPVYLRFPRDWQEYHTRFVTPERFQNALRPKK